MNNKRRLFFSICFFIILGLYLNSAFWFRIKLADFYGAHGYHDKENKIYDKIFRKTQVILNSTSLFYTLSPVKSYCLNKMLFDHYLGSDSRKAVMLYRILSRYEMLKGLYPKIFANYLLNLKQVRSMADNKITFSQDAFQNALIYEYLNSPYWRYRAGMDSIEKGETQKAKDIFQDLLCDYPYLTVIQDRLSRISSARKSDLVLSFDVIGMWKMDNDKGNIAKDYSGCANHGIIYAAKPVMEDGRKAFKFSGKDDYIEITDQFELESAHDLTILFWLKVNAWTDTYTVHLISKYRAVSDAMFIFYLGGTCCGDKMQVLASSEGEWQGVSYASPSIKLNEWYHVAWTYSDDGGALYINSVLQGEKVKAGALGRAKGASLKLGVGDFHGLLSDLCIFNRSLSANEIKRLYEITRLSDDSASIRLDSSTNTNLAQNLF